jgi:hypothetical protein
MTSRIAVAVALVAALVVACDKPSADDCEKALHNMQQLLGTDNLNTTAGIQSEIRACRSGSSKTAVACAINAKSIDDLNKCDFEKQGKHGGIGSAAAGSAGAGSAK